MNALISTGLSLVAGTFFGICYGLFFVHQRRRVLSTSTTISRASWLKLVTPFIGRCILFVIMWHSYLLWPLFNFILFLTPFFGAFWYILLTQKA